MPFHDREQFKDVIAAHGFYDVELMYKVFKEMEQYRLSQVLFNLNYLPILHLYFLGSKLLDD